MFQPLKTAFGRYMYRFFTDLVPTTKPMREYCEREFKYAVMLAPARMIDMADDYLSKYMRSKVGDGPTNPHDLPVIIVAFGRDVTPTGRDYTRQIADPVYVQLPGDELERVFKLKTISSDVRVQVAIFASDEPTARSIAAQFLNFIDASTNRRFKVKYEYAGVPFEFPAQIESPEALAPLMPVEAKNLTVLAVDLNLHCTIPLMRGPSEGEPDDGKGIPGDPYQPSGYPVITDVVVINRDNPNRNA